MNTMQAIQERYSCRNYEHKAVDQEKVEELMKAVYATPIAMKRYEDLHVTVITKEDFLKAWDEATAKMYNQLGEHPLYGVPLVVLLSGRTGEEIPSSTPYLNGGVAVENLALAATELGLGSVIFGGPVRALHGQPALLEQLQLPEGFSPVVALGIGYAAQKPAERETERHLVTNWIS